MSFAEASSSQPGDSSGSFIPENESALCTDAQLTTKPLAQEESSFFLLPAELRNKIYEYLLDPGQDGTCRVVHAVETADGDQELQGVQVECLLCKTGETHHACAPENHSFLTVSGGQRHAFILRTCRNIRDEAMYFFRSTPLHITVHDVADESRPHPSPAETLELFLDNTGLLGTYCFPILTLRFYPAHEEEDEFFSCIDDTGRIIKVINTCIYVNHLEIITRYDEPEFYDYTHWAERHICHMIDELRPRPWKITWAHENVSPKWDRRTASRCRRYFRRINRFFRRVIKADLPRFDEPPAYQDFY